MNSVTIESLDQEGRGIAHADGKVIFIEGALTGESVTYNSYRRKPSYENAQVMHVEKPSFMRVTPKCAHFGVCGGCSMQHLEPRAQVSVKQRVLEDTLWHVGKVRAEHMLTPIYGLPWGYRQRARLSVRHVVKKGKTLVGFHEKRSSFVADMQRCEVLPPKIGTMLEDLARLMDGLSIRDRLPQIEVACGENVDVLVLRVLEPPSPEDEAALCDFADAHEVQFWLQPKGPDSAYPFHPRMAPDLTYTLPEFGIEMPFAPTDFTQVNHRVNRVMVHRTIRLLDPRPGERIADFFCGLGNFTLPIAKCGALVLGAEGSEKLVQRARRNALHNGITDGVEFAAMNLFEMDEAGLNELGRFDKWLVDPPRDGAVELVKAIGAEGPKRIVYVSCNPATLARDAAVLVQAKGYALKAAGVMNMFPQTSHVESIAVFERADAAFKDRL